MPTLAEKAICTACHADEHYQEHGRAWIGGFATGLMALTFQTATLEIDSWCTKHRESFVNYLKVFNAAAGRNIQLVNRPDGWALVIE